MPGPRPAPAGVRELLNSRTRRHHHDTIPDATNPDSLPPSEADVPVPKDLQPTARKYWRQFAPLLVGAKMLTPADLETLADYCRCCDYVRRLDHQLQREFKKKQPDTRNLDAQLRGWIGRKSDLAGVLGLTAVSRVKTAWTGHAHPGPVGRKDAPKSKVAELQEQARQLRIAK